MDIRTEKILQYTRMKQFFLCLNFDHLTWRRNECLAIGRIVRFIQIYRSEDDLLES